MEALLNRYVILKLCAYGNIDLDFIFSFWLRILIELQGSHDYHRLTPIKSQTQFPEVSTQSILPSFNEKRKVTNFIYISGYWKIPLVSFGSAFNSQYFMRVILSEQDFFAAMKWLSEAMGASVMSFGKFFFVWKPGVGGKMQPDLPVSSWVWREEVSDNDGVLWTLRRDC